jgi:P-type Ca2+ transporter type 2C
MASHSVRDSILGPGLVELIRGATAAPAPPESAVEIVQAADRRQVLEIERKVSKVDVRARQLTSCALEEFGLAVESDLVHGLSSAEAARRLAKNGKNKLDEETPPSLFILVVQQFMNLIILLLIAASIASFSLGEVRWSPHATSLESRVPLQLVEGVAVLVIVVITTSISVATESGASKALAALKGLAQPQCRVVRDGAELAIQTEDLVIGDLVKLSIGDIVPADCRVISASDAKVDEALLTGESRHVVKSPSPPKEGDTSLTPQNEMFASTKLTSGTAVGVVVACGMATRVGQIAASLVGAAENKGKAVSSTRPPKEDAPPVSRKKTCCQQLCDSGKRTPLQEQLHRLGLTISAFALVACIAVFVIGVVRDYRDPEHPNNPAAVQMILVAVSLAVSAIPESLPLCVTIALALGTQAMVKQNALVRRLPSVETLGCTTVICSDKTGTLTKNQQTAVRLYLPGQGVVLIEGESDVPLGGFRRKNHPEFVHPREGGLPADLFAILASLALNSTATLRISTSTTRGMKDALGIEYQPLAPELAVDARQKAEAGFKFAVEGNASEAPLLLAAAKAGVMAPLLRLQLPSLRSMATGGRDSSPEVPFNSARKMMASITAAKSSHEREAVVVGEDGKASAVAMSVVTSLSLACAKGDVSAKDVVLAHVKGAPDMVLPQCSHFAMPSETGWAIHRLDSSRTEEIHKTLKKFSHGALRVIAVAVRAMDASNPYGGAPVKDDAGARLDIITGNMTGSTSASAAAAAAAADVTLSMVSGTPGLVFLGLVASMDPHRPEVPPAIEATARAGVRTIMITGDHRDTAIAIAQAIGIIRPGDDPDERAIDCARLRRRKKHSEPSTSHDEVDGYKYISNVEIDEITSRVNVFARAQPTDKLRIVESLQRQKHVVSMTGDGVNDAPALTQADIGVAMGLTGTDVAKGASDLVLLDDSFATIVGAIRKGRQLYANIQSFLQFFLAINASMVASILLCVIVGLPILLKPLSVLVMNVLVSSLPAVSISLEPAADDIMLRAPRPRNQPILHGRMWVAILGHATTMALGGIATFIVGLILQTGGRVLATDLHALVTGAEGVTECTFLGHNGFWQTRPAATCGLLGFKEARTMTFVAFVMAEILRSFTVRSHTKPLWHRWLSNPWLLVSCAMSLAIACIFLFVPGADLVMGFVPLGWPQWLIALALGPLLTSTVDECVKARYSVRVEEDERWKASNHLLREMQTELRQLRHHVVRIEARVAGEEAGE